MANEFRVIGIAFTAESNRGVLHAFIGDIVCNGWAGLVPIAVSHPDPNNVTEHCQAWGGYLYPDFRLMARSSSGDTHTMRTETVLLGQFAHSDCLEQCETIIGSDSYPGFTRPRRDDAVAIFMTDCRFAPPHRWIQTVVDRYHDAGLLFFFASYDLGDASYGSAYLTVFYTANAEIPAQATPTLMAGTRHCIVMRTNRDVSWRPREGNEDGEDDVCPSDTDEEGNESKEAEE